MPGDIADKPHGDRVRWCVEQLLWGGWTPPRDPTGRIVLPPNFVLPRTARLAFRGCTIELAREQGNAAELTRVV